MITQSRIHGTFVAFMYTTLFAAPTLAQPFAYVANLGSNTVSVVDVASQTVVATIAVGDNPDGVATTPDGTRAYVANFLSDNVSVIDTATNTVASTIDVGSGPVGIAVSPDGTFAYVTNRGSNTVTVIRVDTNAPLTTLPVGAGPNAIAITPDGKFAYVTNSFTKSPGTVSVIDLHANAVTATVEVYRNPNRLAITPDGRFVYVSNFRSWNVAVIDTASNAVTTTVPLFGRPSGVAINPNGAYVYVATLGGTVEVIETATNSISNVISVGSDPYGIATTHNGGAGYVANFASGTLSVVDLGDEVSGATVVVGDKPFAVAVNCVGSGCTEPPYTPRPTRTPTTTWTATITATVTPTRPPTFTPTPVPSPIRLEIEPVNGLPGQLATLTVSLRTAGRPVAATQNDLSFDPGTPIAALASGKPDCTVNPDINKGATTFVFQPAGCIANVDCTAVRALVVAFDNVDVIDDGSVLYTCALRIGSNTPPGAYELVIDQASGSDPAGGRLTAEATAGEISVGTPPGATPIPTHTLPPAPTSTATPTSIPTLTSIPTPTVDVAHTAVVQVGAATGTAGQRVQFGVTLDTKGLNVSAIQNDIIFDRRTAVATRANGKPDCVVNPAINKNASGFAFQPPTCTSTGDCDRMRAVIFAIDNGEPIPNGALVYTCNVDIAASAVPGTYPLHNIEVVASSPAGSRVLSTGSDGEIIVIGASGQGLAVQNASMSASGGCQTAESTSPAAAWPLMAAAFLIVRRRRVSRQLGERR